MKSHLLLLSTIVAATAGLSVSSNALSSEPDAQSQAAALLSSSNHFVSESTYDRGNTSSQSVTDDAHAHAAALLSGIRTERKEVSNSVEVIPSRATRKSSDAQAQAAALLSGQRVIESYRITATSEKLGEHPAVVVAQSAGTRGIDPNTFIVAHPARLQLITTSQGEQDALLAKGEPTTPTVASGH